MRVSVRKDDSGYRQFVLGGGAGHWEARLDGRRVNRCITADTDKGYVIKHALGPLGTHMIRNNETVKTRMFGKVELFNMEAKADS